MCDLGIRMLLFDQFVGCVVCEVNLPSSLREKFVVCKVCEVLILFVLFIGCVNR